MGRRTGISTIFTSAWGVRLGLFALASTAGAAVVTGVSEEAVDHYADGSGSIVCIAEADNFVNGLIYSGSGWTRGVRFVDSCSGSSPPCSGVYDTDFCDPNRAGASTFDNDTNNFDRSVDAISFVSVHGICNDISSTSCTSTAACGAGKVCIGHGPTNNSPGWCASLQDRKLYVGLGPGTNNHHSGFIDYTSGQMALGEGPVSGSWGNASTNGGVNFAAVVNSCGVRPGFIAQETWNMFAGVQNVGLVMPVTPQGADDVDAPERGTAFANAYRANPNGSIGLAWRDSILSIPQTDGGGCPTLNSDYSQGGGHGVTGCGAQIAASLDSTQARAQWDNGTESWVQTRDTANKAIGAGYEAWVFRCNYDCNTYPFNL
jgi:hypothetical protein